MKMILAVMYREFRIRTTSFTWLFFDLLMPLTYLLLFGIGLDRAFSGGLDMGGVRVGYNAFFLAGVLSMACFGIGINTSYGFFVDRENGMFYEFLTYPMRRSEFLIGKVVFNSLLALVQASLTVGLGVLILRIPLRWDLLFFALVGIVLGTAAWFFFLSSFALRIRRNDMFNTFINVAYFVFMFASSMFYPVDALPAWLQAGASLNPLTWHTNILRYTTIGVGSLTQTVWEAGAFLVFLLASFAFAVHTLRRGILR